MRLIVIAGKQVFQSGYSLYDFIWNNKASAFPDSVALHPGYAGWILFRMVPGIRDWGQSSEIDKTCNMAGTVAL